VTKAVAKRNDLIFWLLQCWCVLITSEMLCVINASVAVTLRGMSDDFVCRSVEASGPTCRSMTGVLQC